MSALLLPGWAAAQAATSGGPTVELKLAESVVSEAGQVVEQVQLDGKPLAFTALATTRVAPGPHRVRFEVAPSARARLLLAPCAGKSQPRVLLDGAPAAPKVAVTGQTLELAPGPHTVELQLEVSNYERRVACGAPPKVGPATWSELGLRELVFPSPRKAGSCARCRPGHALVYVPRSVAERAPAPAPVLVGLHPWNGALETYAAYEPLLAAAEREGVIVLLPDGLGNSLYVEAAEAEVMAALDALASVLPLDTRRVSLFGASMGGAGATTVGFHRPDRFASVISLFGDAKYDLSTYVRRLLPDEAAARRVNALDVADNARHLSVWLVHGDADTVSKIEQSEMLARALQQRGFAVRFDRKPGRGHEGTLVTELADEIVQRAAQTSIAAAPARVSYRSVRDADLQAYGVRWVKAASESYVDLENVNGELVVHACTGIRSLQLDAARLTGGKPLPVRFAQGVTPVPVSWTGG